MVFVRVRDEHGFKRGHAELVKSSPQNGIRILCSRVYQIKKSVGFKQNRVGFSDVEKARRPSGFRLVRGSVLGYGRRGVCVIAASAKKSQTRKNHGNSSKKAFHCISPIRSHTVFMYSSHDGQQCAPPGSESVTSKPFSFIRAKSSRLSARQKSSLPQISSNLG